MVLLFICDIFLWTQSSSFEVPLYLQPLWGGQYYRRRPTWKPVTSSSCVQIHAAQSAHSIFICWALSPGHLPVCRLIPIICFDEVQNVPQLWGSPFQESNKKCSSLKQWQYFVTLPYRKREAIAGDRHTCMVYAVKRGDTKIWYRWHWLMLAPSHSRLDTQLDIESCTANSPSITCILQKC